jgi:hypothetical protein
MAARRKAAKKKARKAAKPKRRTPGPAEAAKAAKDVLDRVAKTMTAKAAVEFYGQIIDHCQAQTDTLEAAA